jgi:hypothetical protein
LHRLPACIQQNKLPASAVQIAILGVSTAQKNSRQQENFSSGRLRIDQAGLLSGN